MPYINQTYINDTTTTYDIHDIRIPETTSSDSGKVIGVDNSGNYTLINGLTNYDFTYVQSTVSITSPYSASVTFTQNKRCVTSFSIANNFTLNITINNQSDNYIWIYNSSSSTDIDIAMGSVTLPGGVSASSVYMPADGITIPKESYCEIGIIYNSNFGVVITSRSDLAEALTPILPL